MILIDVNVLVYAHKEQTLKHIEYKSWLEKIIAAEVPYGMSEFILSSFLRIVTHPRIFDPPSSIDTALTFAHEVLLQPNCVRITPGERHFSIFTSLLKKCGARGNLVPDAYLAALAIESGCEFITTDSDYARFTGLKWRYPLEKKEQK
ncbi:MAG: type II toxin-antitoxin system VapC family toxin [Deltaproteobacteria bacterium]|nr:type II toxin-antitoxin system VapC family toxin [Deltaproteobacteria bacterium]